MNRRELEFKTVVSNKTGKVSTKSVADYHFGKITIYESGLVLFTGSIHKLWNSLCKVKAPNIKEVKQYKGFNGNQFVINDIIKVRQHLEKLFNCTPNQMIFQNIEFGINTMPIFNPQLFLKGLLYHKGKLFEFKFNEHFAQVVHQRYYFKIYNKSKQYGMLNHTLRVELKVIKTEEIKCLEIKTFADINASTLMKANELLLKRFDEVVYYDNTITKESLTKLNKQTLERYSNPRYWINVLMPKNRDKHKKKLKDFISKCSTDLHQEIRQEIDKKGVIINRLSEIPNGVIINHSSIGLNITPNTLKKESRKCRVTRVDISMQKKGSILLSHTGLKYYYSNNKTSFEEIKNKYLSKKWINAKFDTQIKELAHNIRNKYNNQKIGKDLKHNPNQVLLF
jgi:hypothetical protein